MGLRELVREAFAEIHGWVDTYYLNQQLQELVQKGALQDPEAIASLAAFADLALVHAQLVTLPAKVLVPALLEALAQKEPREGGRWIRSLLDETLLSEPALVATLPPSEKARAERLLTEAGRQLPAAQWRSPWSLPKKKAKTPGRSGPLAIAPFTERVHGTEQIPRIPPDRERDESLERAWAVAGEHGRQTLDVLEQLSEARALELWKAARPENLCVWGNLAEPVLRFGVPGLDSSLAAVTTHLGSDLEALAPVESPRVAPVMADAFAGRPAQRTVARTWFTRFPECAVVGLVPPSLTKERVPSQRALAALAHLRRVSPPAFDAGLARYDEAVRDEVEDRLTRGTDLPSRKPSLPDFAEPSRLPWPVTADGRAALQGEPFAELLSLLKATPLTGAPWLDELKTAFSSASMTRLARALTEAWLGFGAPPKEKWALQVLAHFPDDAAAQDLATMAAKLAPAGLSARAQEMVEVLAAMKTRTGLKLVSELSRKVRSTAFRARAELAFVSAAEAMGLTEDELAERLVPDYGLSPEGVVSADPPIRLVLDGLKPKWLDPAGKPVKHFPQVPEELSELKKKAPSLVREAAERLERSMVRGRRLGIEHFTEVYLMHGLTRPLAAQLVWGIYGEKGLEATFVPGAKGPVNEHGQAVALPEGRTVGVVHPLELPEELRVPYSAQLLGQPFPQLARRAHRYDLTTFRAAMQGYVGRTTASGSLLGLEKKGWQRGGQVGHGCYVSLSRAVTGGEAEIEFDPGIYLGDPRANPEQTLRRFELRGEVVPAQALSELEHDLHLAFGADLTG